MDNGPTTSRGNRSNGDLASALSNYQSWSASSKCGGARVQVLKMIGEG